MVRRVLKYTYGLKGACMVRGNDMGWVEVYGGDGEKM
jgi:hypothetical protein